MANNRIAEQDVKETSEKPSDSEIEKETSEKEKTCFVVMPISNADGYENGHFDRVYEHLIKPACRLAGFKAERADDSNRTNVIILDILTKIVDADMVICDMSSKNPNVMYELGIRQAFNLPVVLLKDNITNRIFDTSPIRDIEYDHTLRIDNINSKVGELTQRLNETYENRDSESHSLINFLKIKPAQIPAKEEISYDTAILLQEMRNIRNEVNLLKKGSNNRVSGMLLNSGFSIKDTRNIIHANLKEFVLNNIGETVYHKRFGEGFIVDLDEASNTIYVDFGETVKRISAPFHDLTMGGVNVEKLIASYIALNDEPQYI